jgi:hypothetical protein
MYMMVDTMMKLPEHPPELPKVDKGELKLSYVDNPGEWHEFTCTAKMDKGKYKHHRLMTSSIPVVPNEHGERHINGWRFMYNGWVDGKGAQSGATQDNLFLPGRKGCLDNKLLQKYGLTEQCMQSCYALFFHQLLLPICAPKRLGIANNECVGYYVKIMYWTAWYAIEGKYNTC